MLMGYHCCTSIVFTTVMTSWLISGQKYGGAYLFSSVHGHMFLEGGKEH